MLSAILFISPNIADFYFSVLDTTNTPWASLVTQTVKNLPAIQETWVQSLGQEDPLERRMATHSSILAWRIPWTREAWQARVHGIARSQIRPSN